MISLFSLAGLIFCPVRLGECGKGVMEGLGLLSEIQVEITVLRWMWLRSRSLDRDILKEEELYLGHN